MRVSTLITALLPTVALASYDSPPVSHTTSISTYTQTRTVMRVFTEIHTGTPNATSYASSGYSSAYSANVTSVAPTAAKVSPTPAVYSPGASNAASRDSLNLALAALAGAAAYVVL